MKVLFVIMFALSLACVVLKKQFEGVLLFTATFVRYIILFSSIIPISLKVNMDMSKTVYSLLINRDKKIKGTIVRNSAIPEELGRINHLFCDKTGTLTRNEMVFKKLCLGKDTLTSDDFESLAQTLHDCFEKKKEGNGELTPHETSIYNMMLGIALCHNVTPCVDSTTGEKRYEASSPDEQSLVRFSEQVGLVLEARTRETITLRTPVSELVFEILLVFPFSSATKRMGIILKEISSSSVLFLMKGADVAIKKTIVPSDWLDEECDNMAREGLRTLVFCQKIISEEEFQIFDSELKAAKSLVAGRAEKVESVRDHFESDMQLVGLTGVEDLLQEGVAEVLENMRRADVNVWMLTGDKVETAICIARSTRLVDRTQELSRLLPDNENDLENLLARFCNESEEESLAVVLDGKSLQMCLDNYRSQFVELVKKSSSVVVARCAPTQKAMVVRLIKKETKGVTTCAIGDGGNDVSMILEASVGIGVEGKEGKQASLAADFSITQFSHLQRLIMWHGTNSYRRGSKMSQFIIHRGMIISILQCVFSAIYYFATIPIFTGWLLVGYSTIYTVLPVFAICCDTEITQKVVEQFPEIYAQLQKRKLLSWKSFILTIWKSAYQGGIIMLIQLLLATFFINSSSLLRIQSIAFTALIFTELIGIGLTSYHLNLWMIIAEVVSVVAYVVSILLLPAYFDIKYVFSWDFVWKTALVTLFSTVPIYLTEFIYNCARPSQHRKISERRPLVEIPKLESM